MFSRDLKSKRGNFWERPGRENGAIFCLGDISGTDGANRAPISSNERENIILSRGKPSLGIGSVSTSLEKGKRCVTSQKRWKKSSKCYHSKSRRDIKILGAWKSSDGPPVTWLGYFLLEGSRLLWNRTTTAEIEKEKERLVDSFLWYFGV